MPAPPTPFWRAEEGATALEFAITLGLFMLALLGIGEFGLAYWQWNSAAKAAQLGARLAVVSNPVSSDLTALTGLSEDIEAGDPMPYFERTCSGRTRTCTNGSYDPAAMNTIVYGRGNSSCPAEPQPYPPMCQIFPRIGPDNVVISYVHTGLGFAGRPGGPVPTVTLSLTGLSYDLILLNRVLGTDSLAMPAFRTTATGEDLSYSGQ